MSSKTITLQLTLTVDYVPNGESEDTLRQLLDRLVIHAVGEGLLTGETKAEVRLWSHYIGVKR